MVVLRVVGGLSVGRERRWSLPLLTGHWTSPHEEWADSEGTAMVVQSRKWYSCNVERVSVCVCVVVL